ncbi:hypothetical protein F2Q69_00038778 [Brassica cretica]|uniref:Uncharacterized protein n=1 Tax=Brassica cretica TaxID=69181 RepID=A0A8S9STG7_BRACR|nr:hypothetical protein F2Q69_00038778 [Brassica cretica]
MIFRRSWHAACLCEVKNVVAWFMWRQVMWHERVNVVVRITWRQRDRIELLLCSIHIGGFLSKGSCDPTLLNNIVKQHEQVYTVAWRNLIDPSDVSADTTRHLCRPDQRDALLHLRLEIFLISSHLP